MFAIRIKRDPSNEWYGRGVNLAIISIVMTSVAACLVAMRLVSRFDLRRVKGKGLGPDDFAIVGSWLFSLGLTIANCISTDNGIGKKTSELNPKHLHATLQTFWAAQITYKFTINLTKLSICLLYLRIFGGNKQFRRTVFFVMTYVLLYAVASIVATILECTPVQRIWDKKVPGTCINLTAFWYSNAAANIIGDVVIFLLPMRMIAGLQMSSSQKVGLRMIFLLGLFVCVTSVLRMTTLRTGGQAQDQTFGTLNSTIWTTIEANTGIICACLPMLKTPLARLFPRYFPRKPEGSANGTLQSHGGTPPNTLAWDAHGMAYRMSPPVPVISKESRGTSNDVSNISNPSSPVGDGHIMPKAAMPKGVITKTTSVNVQYSEDQCCASSTKVSSPNNKDHSRSTSNLVGSEYNTVSSA